MNKRHQSLSFNLKSTTSTDDRFSRLGQNQLLHLIRLAQEPSVPNKKSPLDDQKNIKLTEELKVPVKRVEVKSLPPQSKLEQIIVPKIEVIVQPKLERIAVGNEYNVTKDWDKFWPSYCKHFIPATWKVVHYLNQVVTVLQIQEELVQVRFHPAPETEQIPEGWLPAAVLETTRDVQLVYPEPMKKSTEKKPKKEVSQKLFYQKKLYHKEREIEALKNDKQRLQQALQQSNSQCRLSEQKVRVLQAKLKDAVAVHAREKESFAFQLQSCEALLNTCKEEKQQMCDRIEELESSWVPKDIANLECLLEGCSSDDLCEAQSKIQAKIQESIRRAEHALEMQKYHSSSQKTCTICLDAPKSHMFEPCRHYCVCEVCADRVLQHLPKQCPICRGGVVTSSRVYV